MGRSEKRRKLTEVTRGWKANLKRGQQHPLKRRSDQQVTLREEVVACFFLTNGAAGAGRPFKTEISFESWVFEL